MSKEQYRDHILAVLRERVTQSEDKRKEALEEYLAVTMAAESVSTGERLADMIPPVMTDLYEKWMNMFVDKLFESQEENVLQLICDGSEENNAALVLAYIMFLESARMEEQIDKDLKQYALEHSDDEDLGDTAASYIRARMAQVAATAKKSQ